MVTALLLSHVSSVTPQKQLGGHDMFRTTKNVILFLNARKLLKIMALQYTSTHAYVTRVMLLFLATK